MDGADSSFGQWPVTVRGRAGRLVIERMPARTEVEIGQSMCLGTASRPSSRDAQRRYGRARDNVSYDEDS